MNLHGIIFAYASDSRLKELIEHRTASSIPYGGRYRLIDFTLSGFVNAGITDVGVVVRESYQSLLDHFGSGKDWDLSRKRGGLRLLPPFGYVKDTHTKKVYRGHLEALYATADYISHIRQEYVVMAEGDIVANFPIASMFETHLQSGADVTCAACPISRETESSAYYKVEGGNIEAIAPTRPQETKNFYTDMRIYILSKQMLLKLMKEGQEKGLVSVRELLMERLEEKSLHVAAYLYDGYAHRFHTVADYFAGSMDLLRPEVRADLFNAARPLRTKVRDEPSSYYGDRSKVKNSIVADGCFVEGEVSGSVLARGVRIDKGAVVQNCVLMQGAHVKSGARLTKVVTDKNVTINEGVTLTGAETHPSAIAKGSVVD